MRELAKVRDINEACQKAAAGRGGYVWADTGLPSGRSGVLSERNRITAARTRRGMLQVYELGAGLWSAAYRVYID